MVRKATLDRGLRPEEPLRRRSRHGRRTRRADRARPSQWRGAGGRWMVWVFRVVIWAVLLIIGFRGVTGHRAG